MAEDTRAAGGDAATEIATDCPQGGQALELGSVLIDGTVQLLAEQLSAQGVPVVVADPR